MTGMLYSLPSRDLIADSVEYGEWPLCRYHGVHIKLRQNHTGHVDGRYAVKYFHVFCLWRPNGRQSQGRWAGDSS